MPIGSGLGLRRVTGAKANAWTLEVTRSLTEADLKAAEEMPRHVQPRPLRRLSERHHRIAQLVAVGVKAVEISARTGVTPQNIAALRGDPTFAELVEYYRSQAEAKFLDAQEEMAGLNRDVILELRERLEQQADEFSIGQLTTLMTVTADRTGNGPSSKTEVNVTVGLADRMNEARRRIREQRERQMIDITPREAAE